MRHEFVHAPGKAEAQTTKGTVRGYICDGIYTFKGIPYAKAKRFHAPEPVEPWEGVLECTSYGWVCPLMSTGKPSGELAVPHRYWPMSEDCQNLNVWTPQLDAGKRPVMVWLHGGGYEAGSAIEQNAYEGENMARFGDAVVVSVNHRLNILGYLDLSAFGEEYENSANAGTADLIAALQWVHDNIAQFGGDPECVTIFGQSGGGGKVTTLLQSPEADGLFQRGINMSGVINLLADQNGSGEELVRAMMEELGLADVKELETCSYDRMAAAYLKLKPKFAAADKYVGCTPHKNSHYLGDPVVNGFRRETEHIPMLVGSVFGEFMAFRSLGIDRVKASDEEAISFTSSFLGREKTEELAPLFRKAYPMRSLADLPTLDMIFRGPEIPYIAARSACSGPVWSYLFNQDSPLDGGRAPWHCSDIPYVFHNCELALYTQQDGVEELESKIFETVMAFARTGDPNHAGIPQWKRSVPGEEYTMIFGNEMVAAEPNFDHELQAKYAAYMGPVLARMMARVKVEH